VLSAVSSSAAIETFHTGSTSSINMNTLVDGYYTSTPVNAAVPECNQIEWAAYTDAVHTTPWTGSPLITGSQTAGWNSDSTSVINTGASTSETIYIKANLPGQTGITQSVTKEMIISICNNEVVSIALTSA